MVMKLIGAGMNKRQRGVVLAHWPAYEAMKRVQDSSAMQERLVAMGLESVYLIPNEFAEHIKFEIEKWWGVVRAPEFKPD